MRQSLQIPMLVKSENLIRGRDWGAIYGDHDAQREEVKVLLTEHIIRPPAVVSAEMNQYVVTLCRISAGFLDSEDNLTGAFKHVRDAVARWLGFANDSGKLLRWKYQQQECPKKFYAIRITIDDLSEGDSRDVVVGQQPGILGAITDGWVKAPSSLPGRTKKTHSAKPTTKNTQQGLPFRKSFIACPWDAPAGAPDDDIVVTPLKDFATVERPPEQLQIRIPSQHVDRMLRRFGLSVRGLGPGTGPKLIFERLDHEDPSLGGKCWLYMPVEDG